MIIVQTKPVGTKQIGKVKPGMVFTVEWTDGKKIYIKVMDNSELASTSNEGYWSYGVNLLNGELERMSAGTMCTEMLEATLSL